MVILGFLLWSVIIFIIQNEYTSDNFKMLFKMIINLLFFFTVLNSSEKIVDELFWKRLKIVFEIIIIISFVQYIFLYYKLNLFSLVLNTSDSMTAYRITENPQLLFGELFKNILATKIVLAQICYFILLLINSNLQRKYNDFGIIRL